jgi:hypothetical protein
MEGWEVERKIELYTFAVTMLAAHVQALVIALSLSWCGVGWDENTGTFRKMTGGN